MPQDSQGGTGAPAQVHPNDDKAVGYVRLSAVPVAYDSFSPDNQRRIIQEAAKRDGKTITAWYMDLVTARKAHVKREGHAAAVEEILKQRARTLYVAKLDRLDRRGMGYVGITLDKVEEAGGHIKFLSDGLDTAQPGARHIVAILAEQARAESDAISWRVGQWHEHNRRLGIWNRRRPYGYLVQNGKLVPHPTEAAIVRSIVEDFLNGVSLRQIAVRLNDRDIKPPSLVRNQEARAKGHRAAKPPTISWGYETVERILKAPTLAGLASHEGRLVYDENGDLVFVGTGIVTLAERARILAEFERRTVKVRQSAPLERIGRQTGRGRPASHLLSGLGRCALCNYKLNYQLNRRQRQGLNLDSIYWRCAAKTKGRACPGVFISNRLLEPEVVRRCREELAALEPGDPLFEHIAEQWVEQTIPDSEADQKILEEARAAIEQRISDLYRGRYEANLFPTTDYLVACSPLGCRSTVGSCHRNGEPL